MTERPLSKVEVDDINAHLRGATTPNSPDRMLEGWSMPIYGGIWYLNPVDGPAVELYRHEVVAYVEMLKEAGIEPSPATNLWGRQA